MSDSEANIKRKLFNAMKIYIHIYLWWCISRERIALLFCVSTFLVVVFSRAELV